MVNTTKSTFENINDLLKAVLWPLVIVTILIIYRLEVSNMFRNASKVSLGSFSMEMQREAKNQGLVELSSVISELSVPGIKRLLSMGASNSYGIVGIRRSNGTDEEGYILSADILSWEELIKAGLLEENGFQIAEVVREFTSSGAEESEVYYDDHGNSSNLNESKYPHKGKTYFLPVSQLNSSLKQKFESYSVSLTDNGRKALGIIVETTARQIKKEN